MKVTDKNRDKLADILEFLGIDPNMVSRDDDIDFTVKYTRALRFEQEPLGGYSYDWPTSVTYTV